ncbi:MAG: carboxypeptidase-like regulatory domain-containing protein, partial [Prevotellaceae bacterium]|nr:carboxypeptidase-like regulatory domain-containing protein [Prevotellaceae bacterium]
MNKINKLKKWSTVIIMLLCMFFLSAELRAQNLNIKGKVIDTDGNALTSVAILVKGTAIGVTNNDEGDYVINGVPDGSILEFRLVGYVTQEIKVTGDKTVINVILQEETESLDEIVVVGYGTQRKVSVVASITTIEPAKLKTSTTRSLSNNLAGNLGGIIGVQRSGEPG